MHLLYVDESGGDDPNSKDRHFVLGGISAFERVPYFLSQSVDEIQAQFFPEVTSQIEFRASAIWNGNGSPWNSMERPKRAELMTQVYQLLSRADKRVVLFGVALEKAEMPNAVPIQKTCEEMAGHFDVYLKRLEAERNADKQRGLMIFDQSRHEKTVQALMTEFRTTGASFGKVRRLAEVPLFTDSKITRMLQLADFIAYAIYRRFESSDAKFFDMIVPRFVESDGIVHGLVHLNGNKQCFCAACLTRRTAPTTVAQLPLGLAYRE